MRRLSVILATLAIVLVIKVERVRACKFLNRSTSRCCVSHCCQPRDCLPTVCGPAREVDAQAVEAIEQPPAEPAAAPEVPPAEPADDVPAVTAPEDPPAPQAEEMTAAEEAPPEQPPEEPAATAEETSPADDEAAAKTISEDDAKEPAGGDEAMSEEEAMKAFFGEDAEEPASPAPAKEPEAPKPAPESPAGDEEKSALDDFFSIRTPKPSPDNSHAGDTGFRIWRDVSGRHQLEAKFVTCFEDGTVRLEKPNGRWVRLPYFQLSRADQLVARQMFGPGKMIAMISR